jgi:histidinol dehydrogenase
LFDLITKRLDELSEEELSRLLVRDVGLQDVIPRVNEILEDVRQYGDEALFKYTKEFDEVELVSFQVFEDEIEEAYNEVSPELVEAVELAAANILSFHEEQLDRDLWLTEIVPGVTVGQKIVPLDSVGMYVPGGRASYPSSALMTVIPAAVVGVPRIVVCTPPKSDGLADPLTLVAADLSGADEIYKLGGVQAIAAMAFGTDTIGQVDKIVGPGNVYVTAAKQLLRSAVEIDMPAGPSEVLIIADETGDAEIIAGDMLAQSEHDPDAISVFVSLNEELAASVVREVEAQTEDASRKDIIKQSLERSAVLIADDLAHAIDFSNAFAPEHLELIIEDSFSALSYIRNAGSVFLGSYTPVAAGDYASGTNHVLPTSGYSRVFSGLNIDHYIKKITFQKITERGLMILEDSITMLARAEGLEAHAKSVERRLKRKEE